MIVHNFIYETFRIDLTICQIENNLKDRKKVLALAHKYNLTVDCLEELDKKLKSPTVCDGGYTYWNANSHKIFVVFFPMSSLDEMVCIYDHEKRHVEDRTIQFCGIDDHETSAFIAGRYGVQFRKIQDKYIDTWEASENQ